MSELTITFLGTGTSQGVPMVGCSCAVCESNDPRDKRTRSSIYVQTPEYTWVIDTGTDFRTQCLREKLNQLDAVVYTHSHTDHVMGFDDLRPFCGLDRLLPIYASQETMGDLQRIFAFAFKGENQFPGYVRPDPRVIEGPFHLGETELTPLRVLHGRAHVNGYLFSRGGEKLAAYLSDCKVVPDEVVERIRGVKVLIVDALRHREHPTHMSVAEALQIAERVSPGETWFTHICHELGHAETEVELPPNVRMAYDGLQVRAEVGSSESQFRTAETAPQSQIKVRAALALMRPALAIIVALSFAYSPAIASTPDALATLVVFNNAMPLSADLAGYYAKKRGIPFDHLIGLDCSMAETIERADYDRTIATPLRNAFIERDWWRIATSESTASPARTTASPARTSTVVENKIRYIVLIHGIPLRIAQAANYPGDTPNGPPPMSGCNSAAVDSELACLGYLSKTVSGALNNPYFRSFKSFADAGLPGLMLVCRLDAPTGQIVRRMIDDSLAAEKGGLWGMTYVDSRGLSPGRTGSGPSRTAGPSPTGNDSGPKAGLAEGDAWLNRIAMASRKHAIPVIQDDTPELFPGDYPINYAAQYYGWYSENVSGALAREDFRFVPGAVACHIHSFSATSLRDSHKGWVAPLLARGAAASMGAVFEPYLALTPNLDIFEQHLRDGFSFGESAYASMRVVSWMITVVGDPLYTPFKLLREDPPTKGAAEWEAYQKGAEIWVGQSRDAGAKQLAQSARKLRSGIIFEGLGLLETDAGNGPGALIAFQEARKNYKQQDDIVRVALHEVALLKGRKKEALGLIGKVIREHPTAHGVSLLRAAQTELVPTPTQTGGL